MTTEKLDHNIDTIIQTVFDMINENGTKGVSAILAALVTIATHTDNVAVLAELLNITTEMLKE